MVFAETAVAVPVMAPVATLNSRPAGKAGVIDQVVTVPVTVGVHVAMAESIIKVAESGA